MKENNLFFFFKMVRLGKKENKKEVKKQFKTFKVITCLTFAFNTFCLKSFKFYIVSSKSSKEMKTKYKRYLFKNLHIHNLKVQSNLVIKKVRS